MLGWRRFLLTFLGTTCGVLALISLFIVLMNPYGNLPHILFTEHAIADTNQRYQYPALVRSGAFDSIVIGTSEARLLEPQALNSILGGRFVNLAMNSGRAWEQYKIADLFIRKAPDTRTLLVALDQVWCEADAVEKRTTFRGFPKWMYDDDPWNDLLYMLNTKAVEIAGRRLAAAFGLRPSRFPAGYEVFTPPENAYDPVKVKQKLRDWGSSSAAKPAAPAREPTAEERAAWQFPALPWLDELLERFHGRRLLVYMPVHIVAQPAPGSHAEAREQECKARIAEMARKHGAVPVIDFRIRSKITANDDNYWDPLHYRLPIADRVVKDLGEALAGREDPNGDWRYLDGSNLAAALPRQP
jgi:hypothetical protein